MIAYEEALAKILNRVELWPVRDVPLNDALGSVLTSDLSAPFDVPLFDNSAVDGFALAAPVLGAGERLKIVGSQFAGTSNPNLVVASGEAVQVATGAMLPVGTTCIVMVEDTLRVGNALTVTAPVPKGSGIREKGREMRAGESIQLKGVEAGPTVVSLLASFGLETASVRVKPSIGILVTGNELAEIGAGLEPGEIYESNSWAMRSALSLTGFECRVQHVRDDLASTVQALEGLLAECEVVMTCGGASVGERDFAKEALCALGFEFEFEKVAVKPGKPFAFGHRGTKTAFCLPGNPMSALVTMAIFAWPFIIASQGSEIASARAKLKSPVPGDSLRRCFVPGRLELKDGAALFDPVVPIGSHSIGGLAHTPYLASVPNGVLELPTGTVVDIFAMPWVKLP